MIHGILNVYKEKGYTSHDVVAKLRGIVKQKKIGHTGTLDPEAEGVLPVCLGTATRVCDLLTEKKKTYRAVLLLGKVTDTQDLTGQVLSQRPVECREEQVREVLGSFVGEREQIPPMYSAVKVNGKRLYELARQGQEVERKPRKVIFYEILPEKIELPRVTFLVTCSKGTYIRTLCHDIGESLGCGGCMESLIRTASGSFRAEESHTLDCIKYMVEENRLEEILQPVDTVFFDLPGVTLGEKALRLVQNGNPFPGSMVQEKGEPEDGKRVRVYGENQEFLAVYQWKAKQSLYYPVKMFLPDRR